MKTFPKNFTWGVSTSSYQIEGAWLEGGKGPSIWDVFSHTPGKVDKNDNGDNACNHYFQYKNDIKLMAQMGLKNYRFSISWPRIQPTGKGKANPAGIKFYSDLIDTLLENGITPWATLFHWDLPAALQFEHDGWLNPVMPDYFRDYADICFEYFGDRVKHWLTLNEPWVYSIFGHGYGVMAPGRKSSTEPYQVGHQMLRAHAKTVECYRQKYQHKQNGIISMANNCEWREPFTDSKEDQDAAQRSLEFYLGWFADPVFIGDYPDVMKKNLGNRLPRFSTDDKTLLKSAADFFGLNHYTTMYASQAGKNDNGEENIYNNGGIFKDQLVKLSSAETWGKTEMEWNIVPWGCRKLLEWIDERYDRPEIVLTENGCATKDKVESGAVNDQARINFLNDYISECHIAIEKGVRLSGYFVWSFLDNFEWALGYSKRFGLHYIDYQTGNRIPKESAKWYGDVIKNNGLND